MRPITLEWLIFLLLCILSMMTIYISSINHGYNGFGSAMDAVIILEQGNVYPLLILITGIAQLKLLSNDSNPMIVLKYANKRKLWISQCTSAFVMASIVSIITLTTGFICTWLNFHTISNWTQEGSVFYTSLITQRVAPVLKFAPAAILLISWIMFTLLFYIVWIFTMLIENLTTRLTIAALILATAMGWELVYKSGFYLLAPKMVMWTSSLICIRMIVTSVIVAILLTIIGLFISNRREYLNKHI